MRRAGIAVVLLCLLAACSSPARAVGRPLPPINPTDFHHGAADPSGGADDLVGVATVARHLDIPWGLGFLPDGSALVTERRTRRIVRVSPAGAVTPVARIGEATSDNEGGLLGLAVSPRYRSDRTFFVFYTTAVDNRIARMRPGERPRPIVTGIPKGGIHDGGRLAFGPDGYLYATTGDASHTESAQRLDSLGGKILRMTPEGRPAPGNPFPGSLVWSYGHRNPEGLAWDAAGTMYSAEIGEAVWDELNIIRPGADYGWPAVEGMGHDARYVNPVATWQPEVGVSAGVAVTGSTLIVTCLRGQRIYLAPLTRSGLAGRPVEALTAKYGRLRTAVTAPDGSVWITTSNRDGRNDKGPAPDDDRVLRLTLR